MDFTFYKYHGTGNDFILIDDRGERFPSTDKELIAGLCKRRFGIGADGLILLRNDRESDFKMLYFNSDGGESTMCGNGGRSIVQFAFDLGIIGNQTTFRAIDGLHNAKVDEEGVALEMIEPTKIKEVKNGFFIDTGSPHHVSLVADVDEVDVFNQGRKWRNEIYGDEGANINFVEVFDEGIKVRTYERGVEDETYSCGTGVTAAAIVAYSEGIVSKKPVKVVTLGGELSIDFTTDNSSYTKVVLTGPATYVYEGTFTI